MTINEGAKDMEAMKASILKNIQYRFPKSNGAEYIIPMIILCLSIGLIVGGGLFRSWFAIISGTILLIFLGWSLK